MAAHTITVIEGKARDHFEHINDNELRTRLAEARIVILPDHLDAGENVANFSSETESLFQFLRENFPLARPEVAATDEQYANLVRHGADLWLPAVLLMFSEWKGAEVALGVLSNFVYDRLKGVLEPEKATVHSKIYVNKNKGELKIEYKGPPGTYEKVMAKALKDALR